MLDELTASGEVLWAGHGSAARHRRLGVAAPRRPGAADAARARQPVEHVASCTRPCSTRSRRAARGSSGSSPTAVGSTDDAALAAALWDLVWAGRSATTPSPRCARSPAAARRSPPHPAAAAAGPDASTTAAAGAAGCAPAPPETAGRWSLLPELDTDPTRRAHATAERLLERHGVVTRGAVMQRAGAGRLRGGLQGALGVRGLRPLPARLLRRGPGRRPVRHRRRDRPAAHLHRRSAATGDEARGRRARRDRPGQPLRRGAALARARDLEGGPPARAARPARWSSWSTARSPSTSSAAAAPCSPGPTTPTCSARPPQSLAEAGAPRRAGPADGREGRRRAAPRRRLDAAARGARRGRLRRDARGLG